MVIRVSGIILAPGKHLVVSLQNIFGIGKKRALQICEAVGISPITKVSSLSQDAISKIQFNVNTYLVEGDLRRIIARNIKRLRDIKCYRGMRHRLSLPVRGQRTRTNASTRKKHNTNKIG